MGFRSVGKWFGLALPPMLLIIWTVFFVFLLFRYVDLKPAVEPHFFFAETDPAYRQDFKIKSIFPEPEQLVLATKGPIDSPVYIDKVRRLSSELDAMPEFFGVQSLTHGPKSPQSAYRSPLWKRILFAKDGQATVIMLFTYSQISEETFWMIEKIADRYEDEQFDVLISGAPYVTELIRRYLFGDLKTFSLTAFIMFSLMMLIIFRSLRLLLGTMVACTNAIILTLFAINALDIRMGPLTANLTTIVFVMTLSHIAYMTSNWRHCLEHPETLKRDPALEAPILTLHGSFWSMFTTLLGFASLYFVEAAPFQKLGISGSIGTLIAFFVSYFVYPWFLKWKGPSAGLVPASQPGVRLITNFLAKKNVPLTVLIFLAVITAGTGLVKINYDPHLLSYFKPGTELRDGLDYMDHQWGSSGLKIVISEKNGGKFNDKAVYEKLWDLQKVLEIHPSAGDMVSLSLILAEAKDRVPFSFLFRLETFLKYLERPAYGEITQQFVSPDRTKTVLLLRMRDLERKESRRIIVDRIKEIIIEKGFVPEMIGGLYFLQGELARVVLESLFSGLGQLLFIFFFIGLFLSHSVMVSAALFVSLVIIPVWLLGITGYLRIPLDIISAPASNLAIAMGVDAMCHTLVMVRRCHRENMNAWQAWVEARLRLWKPILSSALIVCSGFAIFTLSYFPPTQRFGISIISGTIMSVIAVLFVLPVIAGVKNEAPKAHEVKKKLRKRSK